MKTICVNIFKFEELSETAKQTAIDNYRNKGIDDFWASDREESFYKAGAIYKQLENIENEIKGARLYTWLQNNVIDGFIKLNRISKHTDGTIKNSDFQYKYDCTKFRVSRIFVTNNLENCPLTGVCYDFDFLKPIIDFINNPKSNITNIDLANDMPSYESIAERDYEEQNSDEYISEHLIANEYEFTEEGKRW